MFVCVRLPRSIPKDKQSGFNWGLPRSIPKDKQGGFNWVAKK